MEGLTVANSLNIRWWIFII